MGDMWNFVISWKLCYQDMMNILNIYFLYNYENY